MKIISPSVEILTPITGDELKAIERAGRTCYKSENKITDESAEKFVKGIIERGHEAMLEHSSLSVKFICDRGVSHEIVRHRMASFAQESTRYCNYGTDKFDNGLTFITPCFFKEGSKEWMSWLSVMTLCEAYYLHLVNDLKRTPQEARSVLPNSVKTELIMTANYREWRHFFKLRALGVTGPAHPQMQEVAGMLLNQVAEKIPVVFDDLYEKWGDALFDTAVKDFNIKMRKEECYSKYLGEPWKSAEVYLDSKTK